MALPNRDTHGRFTRGAGASVSVNPHALERVKARIEERVRHAVPHRMSVGIHEAEGEQEKLDYNGRGAGSPLIRIAAAHELGIGVPTRSWLRTWFDQNRERLKQQMVQSHRAEFAGEQGAIERIGRDWAREVQEWVEYQDGNLRSLEAATIAAKLAAELASPETPLFATGQLVASIKAHLDGEPL